MAVAGKTIIQLFRSITSGTRASLLAGGELFLNQADGTISWLDETGVIRTAWIDNDRGVPKTVTTATYTVQPSDRYLIFNATTPVTVTLPPANAINAGRALTMKTLSVLGVVAASASVVTALASNVLGTAILPATAGKWSKIVCDGRQWVTMESN